MPVNPTPKLSSTEKTKVLIVSAWQANADLIAVFLIGGIIGFIIGGW